MKKKLTIEEFTVGLKLINLDSFLDERGSYIKLYSKKEMEKIGVNAEFVDDNFLISKKKSFRGLHYQIENPEAKLIKCVEGKILDIAVDLRSGSETFEKVFCMELSEEKNQILFVPEGFAHGFLSLEDSKVWYKSSNYYYAQDQYGLNIKSESIKANLEKYIKIDEIILSEKIKNCLF